MIGSGVVPRGGIWSGHRTGRQQTMKNLRYDRHGINDGCGRRLATFSEEGRPMAEAGLGRLFAYSPDLLEALDGILQWWMESDGGDDMPAELFDRAQEALKAARGGAR